MTQAILAKRHSLIAAAVIGSLSLALELPAFAGPAPVQGDYRTKGAGNIENPAIWEQLSASGWVAVATAPDPASANTLFVYHALSVGNATTRASITVGAGGILTLSAPATVTNALVVENGGNLVVNNQLSFSATAGFTVENGGSATLNFAFTNPETSIWNGLENFAPASTVKIKTWNLALPILNSNTAITAGTYNSQTAVFGHLDLEFGTTAVPGLQIMSAGFTRNLAHGNVTFVSAATGSVCMVGGSASAVYGNVTVEQGFAGSAVYLSSSQLTINGNLVQKAGTVFASRGTAAATDLHIKGNLLISGGSFDLSPQNPISTATVNANLAGALEVAASALLTNTFTAGADAGRVLLNLNGTAPQSLKVYSTVSGIPLRILAGATAVLGANLKVNRSTVATVVQNGAILDFNGNIFEGTSGFTQLAGATLRITSANGLDAEGGNVQSSLNGRKFDKDGIYHFTGSVPQITGSGLNPASGQKTIIIDNPTSVTITQPVSFSTTGGAIDIRQGTLLETAAGFATITNSSNSVQLKMAANTGYKSAALATGYNSVHNSFPQMGGTWAIDASSLLELNGAGSQILRSSTTSKVYGNITFSNSGTKTLANNVANIAGTVTIKDQAVVDAQANSFGGTATNFTMTGGRFRTSRSGTQPMMNGAYNLSAGVVELYGTGATGATQTIKAGKTYFSVELTAEEANTTTYNVLHGSGTVTVLNEFRVKAPAVYQIAGSNNYVIGASANSGSFVLEGGATLKYGNSLGITSQECGTGASCGNIRTPQRQFPAEASYGLIGAATNMVTGNGLPHTVQNFYLDRGNTNIVTLTNPLKITTALVFRNGKLKTTDAALLTFSEGAEALGATSASYVSGPVAKAGSDAFLFPVGSDAHYAPAGISEADSDNLIIVRYTPQSPVTIAPSASLSAPIWELQSQEYWQLVRLAGNAPVAVDLSWSETRSGSTSSLDHLVIARLSNQNSWTSLGGRDLATTGETTLLRTTNAVKNLGYFALAIAEIPNGMTPLPIELISFSAEVKSQGVELSWATASEKDNAWFTVERSPDGLNYTAVGKVASQGDADYRQSYRFTDAYKPIAQTYYRLRQTDHDGTFTISKPVLVNGTLTQGLEIDVYPNPAQRELTVRFTQAYSGSVLFRVLDVSGSVLSATKTSLAKGSNQVKLPVFGLKPGLYLLEVVSDTNRETVRFEKF